MKFNKEKFERKFSRLLDIALKRQSNQNKVFELFLKRVEEMNQKKENYEFTKKYSNDSLKIMATYSTYVLARTSVRHFHMKMAKNGMLYLVNNKWTDVRDIAGSLS